MDRGRCELTSKRIAISTAIIAVDSRNGFGGCHATKTWFYGAVFIVSVLRSELGPFGPGAERVPDTGRTGAVVGSGRALSRFPAVADHHRRDESSGDSGCR